MQVAWMDDLEQDRHVSEANLKEGLLRQAGDLWDMLQTALAFLKKPTNAEHMLLGFPEPL